MTPPTSIHYHRILLFKQSSFFISTVGQGLAQCLEYALRRNQLIGQLISLVRTAFLGARAWLEDTLMEARLYVGRISSSCQKTDTSGASSVEDVHCLLSVTSTACRVLNPPSLVEDSPSTPRYAY